MSTSASITTRAGWCGRLTARTFTKQFYPPDLPHLEYTPHNLLAEMDYAGVDKVLLHVDAMLGRDPAFQAESVAVDPERIYSMAPVDEWRLAGELDAVIAETVAAVEQHGPARDQVQPAPRLLLSFRPVGRGALASVLGGGGRARRVRVFLRSAPGRAKRRCCRLWRVGGAATWPSSTFWCAGWSATRDVLCSLTHGFPWRLFLDDDPAASPSRIDLPDEIWTPFANPNLSLEVCFPVRLGDLFDYPYRELRPTLEQMVERIGADRLLWGTDMPFQNRFCTYRQSRRWIEDYCEFLSAEDLAAIMGGTCARVLALEN